MERRELVLVGVARSLLISVTAATVAVTVAVLASPFMPIGLARTAELHHGFDVDALVIGVGFVLTGAGVVRDRARWPAWRATQPAARRSPRSTARRGSRARCRVDGSRRARRSVSGSRSTPGAGPTAVPVWTGILGRRPVDRAADRRLVVPGQSPAPRRQPASLRLELGREDRRARAARDRRACLIPAFEKDPGVRGISAGTVVQVQIGQRPGRRARARRGAGHGRADAARGSPTARGPRGRARHQDARASRSVRRRRTSRSCSAARRSGCASWAGPCSPSSATPASSGRERS